MLNTNFANSTHAALVEESLKNAYNTLSDFANREEFLLKIQTAFGETFHADKLEGLRQQWIAGDFASLPQIEILTGTQLSGANAAYAGENNTIYFSEDFLSQYADNLSAINSVLLEEIGHYVDWQINDEDTPGDEGELFSNLVQGFELSESQVQALQGEDDAIVLKSDINFTENFLKLEADLESSDGWNYTPYNWDADNAADLVYAAIIEERGQSKVVYMNGIWNTYDGAKPGAENLQNTFNIDLSLKDSFDYQFVWNPTKDGDMGFGGLLSFQIQEQIDKFNDVVNEKLYDYTIKKYEKKIEEDPSLLDSLTLENAAYLQKLKLISDDLLDWASLMKIDALNIVDFFDKYGGIDNFIESLDTFEDVDSDIAEFFIQYLDKKPATVSEQVNEGKAKEIKKLQEEEDIEQGAWVNEAILWLAKNPRNSLQLLAHSQGNLFIEDALNKIIEAAPTNLSRIQVIGFASPTNYSQVKSEHSDLEIELIEKNGSDFVPDLQIDANVSYKKKFQKFFGDFLTRDIPLGVAAGLKDHTLKANLENEDLVFQARSSFSSFFDSKQHHYDGYHFNDTSPTSLYQSTHEGYAWSDYIEGWGGQSQTFIAKAGNDVIRAKDQNDVLIGGSGYDFLDGGKGVDIADYSDPGEQTSPIVVEYSSRAGYDIYTVVDSRGHQDVLSSVEVILGTSYQYSGFTGPVPPGTQLFADRMSGGYGTDIFLGLGGNDNLLGHDGCDFLDGGNDADFIDGGDKSDIIIGGEGKDEIYGGSGKDVIYGDQQELQDDDGDIIIEASFTSFSRSIYAETSTTNLVNENSLNINELSSSIQNFDPNGSYEDKISGGEDADKIYAGFGNDTVSGDGGSDLIYGDSGDDRISGDGGNDRIQGNLGQDNISGGDNEDTIQGNEDNDIISGDNGNDYIEGNTGDDSISGGNQDDQIFGNEGEDNITGDAGQDNIEGNDGNDSIQGNDGLDTISGGNAKDTISGGNDSDQIFGDAGDDSITGDGGDDYISGGDNNDIIAGNLGNDSIQGDAGDDNI
ncbi:calcium-binding protein, partial [Phormidium sp. CCY1219]|uniref:calcium-binding protein n=1 Tax=Phormidium sp. CCY1219 TaxID=2886104 RepID=UPI002D1E6008